MAAATANRDISYQPADIVAYNGSSGQRYYAGTMVVRLASGAIAPAVVGAGASNSAFLGVAREEVNLTTNNGLSNLRLNLYKHGEFTFAAGPGGGVSTDIGRVVFALDDQTVGASAAAPYLAVGEVTGIPTSTTYRVRITNYVGRTSTNS